MIIADKLTELGIELKGRTAGQHKTKCPKCSESRKHKNEPCLSVNIDEGTYMCHNPGCEWSTGGRVYEKNKKIYVEPKFNSTTLSEKTIAWFKARGISHDTLMAWNVTESKHYFPQVSAERTAINYNYYRDGKLVNVKYRDGQKNFMMAKGAELIFYGLDKLDGHSSCICVEGENDALAYYESGQISVCSVPNGASKGSLKMEYLDNCIEEFKDFDTIYIATDNDDPGIVLRGELAKRLGKSRCKWIDFGDCKDANEYLLKYGKERLFETITKNSHSFPVEGIIRVNEFEEQIDYIYKNGFPKGFGVGNAAFDRHLRYIGGQWTLVVGFPFSGKALDITTPIPTENGFKSMGEIVPGDVVFDENGKKCNVIAVTPVMHNRPCMEVTFMDGSKIIADEEHEWYTRQDSVRSGVYGDKKRTALRKGPKTRTYQEYKRTYPSIVTTKQISNTLIVSGDVFNHQVPLPGPIIGNDAELLIPPYTLGAWLGDGSSYNNGITCGNTDHQILDEIMRDGFEVSKRSSIYAYGILKLCNPLGKLNLLQNKHIPSAYLFSTQENRLSLLQGIMDTDGTIDKTGSCELSFCNERLAEDSLILIRSLGIKASISSSPAKLYGRVVGTRYRIHFTTLIPIFRLDRKLKRIKNKPLRTAWIGIRSCEPVASVPVRCIQVDSPSHLYLAGESFKPTHNSEIVDQITLSMAYRHSWKAGIFSSESMPYEFHFVKLAEKFCMKRWQDIKPWELKKAKEWIHEHFYWINISEKDLSVDKVIERYEDLVVTAGVKSFVIDPWNQLAHQFTNETQYINRALTKITRFVQATDSHLWLVAHPTKPQKTKDGGILNPRLSDAAGSMNFANQALNGMTIIRDFETNTSEVQVQKVKFKYLGGLGTVPLHWSGEKGGSYWDIRADDKVEQTSLELPIDSFHTPKSIDEEMPF